MSLIPKQKTPKRASFRLNVAEGHIRVLRAETNERAHPTIETIFQLANYCLTNLLPVPHSVILNAEEWDRFINLAATLVPVAKRG